MQAQSQRAPLADNGNDPSADQCERMVSILTMQLADLEDLVADLTERRRAWAERLSLIRKGDVQAAIPRAPHGAVKALVLHELANSPEGLEIEAVVDRVGNQLPMITQPSIRQVLMRLAKQGKVQKTGLKWSALS